MAARGVFVFSEVLRPLPFFDNFDSKLDPGLTLQEPPFKIQEMSAFTMPALVDYSSNQAPPAEPLSSASNVILIDNYDSFTWNVYQYLVLEGATVTVHRNDKISLEELIAQRPTQLIISPGPGHPDTDSGVSRDAVQHFAGKIPILGVCMGQFV